MANDGQGAPRVLVTGAGGGLGRHLAVDFARRGCRIAIADLNAAGVEESLASAVSLVPRALRWSAT